MIGETVGSYRILRELGQGGMGRVYVAEHAVIGREVAVKMLLPGVSGKADVLGRFFNEAKATASLKHPGIVDIFDYGTHSGTGSAYIVMELLVGESLATRLERRGPLPVGEIVSIARQVASATSAAHRAGVVHRDLKPDNIFLVPDEAVACGLRVKVLDFGIAKLSTDVDSLIKTRTNAVLGTAYYMSPEQCRSSTSVDGRSDIYALGCVVFEMATGHVPFRGQGLGDIIAAHLIDLAPALVSVLPTAPLVLESFVARCLEKQADRRYHTMADVANALVALSVLETQASVSASAAVLARDGGASHLAHPRSVSSAPTLRAADASLRPWLTTLGGTASESVPRTTSARASSIYNDGLHQPEKGNNGLTSTSARYVRFNPTKVAADYASLAELEVYSSAYTVRQPDANSVKFCNYTGIVRDLALVVSH